jgi:hypothetical protein
MVGRILVVARSWAALERIDETTYRLPPLGRSGSYDVSVDGRGGIAGGGRGDVVVSLRWDTLSDGPFAVPKATTSILAGDDEVVDSYGVELRVQNLRATPVEATARAIVRAANGEAVVLDLTPIRPPCTPEGTLFFEGDKAEALAAVALGAPPFTYEVELSLDDVTHRALVTWPVDEDPVCAPCVPLLFDPPLPGL